MSVGSHQFDSLAKHPQTPQTLHRFRLWETFPIRNCAVVKVKKGRLTLLPRKRVHSLSVGLLNAFVFICPGSRDLGENRIALKRIPAHGLKSSGCGQGKHKLDVGEQPPQNVFMVLRSAADLSKRSKPELLRSFALHGAQRKLAISVPCGDAPTVLIKEKKSSLGKSLVVCCSVNSTVVWDTENQSSDSSPTLRQMRLCAALPPGAGSCDVPQLALMQGTRAHPSATPTSCRCWVSAENRDITDRRVVLSVPLFDHCSVMK